MESLGPLKLLSTKLAVPTLRTRLVVRSQLIHRLDQGLECGFVLVSAPAGYGKSTLLSAWLNRVEYANAWLTLDLADNDPVRFLTYLAAALRKVDPASGDALAVLLQSSPLPATEIFLTPLVNQISQLEQPFWLVLDDYHLIQNQAIHEVISFLLGHRPAAFHLVIATRADPPLPLSRMRARFQMIELRLDALRLSMNEIEEFFDQVIGLDLSDEDLALLEASTEGWVAGLQMAGLSLQGRADVSEYIRSFSGENRYILDFLFNEVFRHQPADIQNFLLQTSILERLSGSLCDKVVMREDSQSILDTLERSNLFVIMLDEQREWYRYHHLFSDLLRARLKSAFPDSIPLLHQRASAWYEEEGDLENAIIHTLAASDFEHAAGLIERVVQNLDRHNKQALLNFWLDQLPREILEARPWMCVYRAWGHYWTGRRETEEEWLRLAETASKEIFAEDDPEKRHIQGHIATIRALIALTAEDIPGVLEMGQKGLALLPDGDDMRCEAAIALGGAYWALGDVLQAEEAFRIAKEAALEVSRTLAVPSTCYLGTQQVKRGRLREALATFREGLRLASLPDGTETLVAGFPNVRLGDVLLERNELDLASLHLTRGMEQCVRLGQPDVLTEAYVCLGRYQLAVGDPEAVHEMLQMADRVAQRTNVDPFVLTWRDACRLKAWLTEGNLDAAVRWAQNSGLSNDGPFNYLHDLPHLNLARVLVAQGIFGGSRSSYDETAGLLARLLVGAEKAGWVHEQIEILVLQAVHCKGFGEEEGALRSLVAATILAEPGGYIRVFVDEGAVVRDLLSSLAANLRTSQGATTLLGMNVQKKQRVRLEEYISLLLSEYGVLPGQFVLEENAGSPVQLWRRSLPGNGPESRWMAEPLTEREMDVFELLAKGLPDKKIAENLVITRETVHKHLGNIYGKLDVHSRTEAIVRARELGLI